MRRRPLQNPHRVGLRHPFAQNFAGLVPVDQKHQRSAERLEKGVAAHRALERIAAGDEIERAVVAEAGRAFALEAAPLHRKAAQEFGEEFCARQMHVGVGDRHGIRIDGDDDDMGVGFADVVLNRQPVAGARRRGREAGMTEFEFFGRGDAVHERFDRRPVFVAQAVDMGAGDHLLRVRGGELVQRLVQIHHQAVQAVAAAVEQAGQSCDFGKADIVAGAEMRIFLDRREPRGRRIALGRVAGLDGGEHGGRVVPDRPA